MVTTSKNVVVICDDGVFIFDKGVVVTTSKNVVVICDDGVIIGKNVW